MKKGKAVRKGMEWSVARLLGIAEEPTGSRVGVQLGGRVVWFGKRRPKTKRVYLSSENR